MQVERLEELLQQYHPKLIYTIPNFHNPTGTCLSSPRRRDLLVLADRYNVPILEDDFVGDLRYDGRTQPSLKALDPGGRVIYISTFSKMLMPGLRVGFLVADGPVYDSLVDFKYVNDLATSTLIQRALETYVTVGRYQAHLRRSCQVFRKRRDTMLVAIQRYLPEVFAWTHHKEGYSSGCNYRIICHRKNCWHWLTKRALTLYLAIIFSQTIPMARIGYDLILWSRPPDKIEEGIQRMGKAIQRLRANS